MKATAQVANPRDTAITISVTMTFSEAKELLGQMSSSHPSWVFASVLRQALAQTIEHVSIAQEVAS